jgi:hypothetical protein
LNLIRSSKRGTYYSLERNLEGPDSGKDLVGGVVGITVRDQLAVDLMIHPGLGDFVNKNLGTWYEFLNLLSH